MSDDGHIKAPPLRLAALEERAFLEMWASSVSSLLLRRIGRGDGHPVLVLPGFMAGDASTGRLKQILRGHGYWVHGWHQGRNSGPSAEILDGTRRRLLELHERHGRRVSVIGQSLGGIYARDLAREFPEAVRQAITLASPFRIRRGDHSTVTVLMERLGVSVERFDEIEGAELREEDRPPLLVPATAIYSRTDGIVRWHACIDAEGSQRENIAVRGSHSGLAVNPAAVLAIADRLGQPEGEWRPFRPPRGTGYLFPEPASWRPPRSRQESAS
jgi:pimeloyl-ACP methyl ester carboxylesterase